MFLFIAILYHLKLNSSLKLSIEIAFNFAIIDRYICNVYILYPDSIDILFRFTADELPLYTPISTEAAVV